MSCWHFTSCTPTTSAFWAASQSKKPLSAAEVVLEEVEGNPGYYTSKFFLRPHYQLEGLTVSLRLVSRLPFFVVVPADVPVDSLIVY